MRSSISLQLQWEWACVVRVCACVELWGVARPVGWLVKHTSAKRSATLCKRLQCAAESSSSKLFCAITSQIVRARCTSLLTSARRSSALQTPSREHKTETPRTGSNPFLTHSFFLSNPPQKIKKEHYERDRAPLSSFFLNLAPYPLIQLLRKDNKEPYVSALRGPSLR